MITSQEINAMISMQQQQAGYMGGVPMAAPMSGASQYPPQFSYAPQRMGAAHLGQAAAGGLMNSVGPGAGGLSSMAFSITGAAGIGAMGAGFMGFKGAQSAFGALESNALLGGMARLNPLNSMMMGGMAGVAEAGGMGSLLTGAGIRAGLAGAFGTAGLLNPISVAAMAASAPLMAMHRGAQQYSQTSAMIGSYNQFANPFASTGRGFSENQMSSMVSGMRSIQEASPFISMRDMQQTMTRFNEMGMNQGERDAEEFSRKFKAMAKTVTAMSKALGTTMDEASKVFGQMRGAGFYTGADVMQNTVLAGTMRGQGISGSTMIGAQTAGGGISRAGGLGTTPGAKAVGGVMSMLTGGRGAGALTNEEMMNITGAATPDQAIAQLSTTMAGSLTGFYTQTGVGQSMLAALGQTNDRGEFTGGLDAEAIEGLRSGKIDINNLVSKGRGKVSTRNAALSFKTKGQDVAGALLSEGDPTAAIGAIMQSVAGDKFKDMDPENLVTLLTERIQGLGRKEAEAMTKLYREGEKIRRESQQQIRQEMQSEIFATDVRESHSYEGFKRRVLGGISDFFSPFGQLGQEVSVGTGNFMQRVSDDIFGVTRVGGSRGVEDKRLRDILLGNASVGDVGSLGVSSGYRDTGLTTRAQEGVAQASEFEAPKTFTEKVYYERLRAALSNEAFGQGTKSMSADEYMRGLVLQGRVGDNGEKAYTASVQDILSGTVPGGSEITPERIRELMGAAAVEQGSTVALRTSANLTGGDVSRSLKEVKEQQIGILQEGFDAFGSEATHLENLYTSGGIEVAQALGGKIGNERFISIMNQARATGTSAKELLAKEGVDVQGLNDSKLRAYEAWVDENGQTGLSSDQLSRLAGLAGKSQAMMDYSTLAAQATASAGAAEDQVGREELLALASAASSGRSDFVTSATEDLLTAFAEGNVDVKDVTEDKYGALSKPLAKAMADRKIIESGSDEDVRRLLKSMDLSDAEIAGMDLSNREELKSRVTQYDIESGASTLGGAYTSSSQEQAAKYYEQLFSRVNDQILRIQSNNDKLEAKIEALQPD